jgi:hypothetical protein
MMETSHLRQSDDGAPFGRLNRPRLRRIFGQPQVSPATVIIGLEREQQQEKKKA